MLIISCDWMFSELNPTQLQPAEKTNTHTHTQTQTHTHTHTHLLQRVKVCVLVEAAHAAPGQVAAKLGAGEPPTSRGCPLCSDAGNHSPNL